ncbi:preprotein translocase subunit YajC [Limosilactobacillus ingluviei]|uniref:preprotein translocase subunit YajC n=1 Tax=Limosilactobacillus ingluviei TaxID=148604 RepID=UPI0024BAE455|nr:preprotein translocase subunit YajC [Limosilactobacillus ingluviei]
MSSILLIVLMVALMYFFMIRPQQKQQKKHQSMMSQLKPGDHVVTIGRLHGVVAEIDQQKRTVTLDCEGVYLVFDLGAIQRVEAQATEAPSSAADAEAEAKAEPTAKADVEQPAEPEEAAPAEKATEDK